MGTSSSRAGALFLAEYSGMSVAQISKLRRELDNVGGEFKVAKNTLLKIARGRDAGRGAAGPVRGSERRDLQFQGPCRRGKSADGNCQGRAQAQAEMGPAWERSDLAHPDIATLATIPPRRCSSVSFSGSCSACLRDSSVHFRGISCSLC